MEINVVNVVKIYTLTRLCKNAYLVQQVFNLIKLLRAVNVNNKLTGMDIHAFLAIIQNISI